MYFNSDTDLYRVIGANIKQYREQAKLTQVQLAEQAKISISYISKIEATGCDKTGKPLETMFITQTASIIDELLSKRKFQDTKLYKKFQRLLYVPISKDGAPKDWMYLNPIQVDLSLQKYSALAKQLEADYYNICEQLNQQLSESDKATLHTASGEFIQIRTKDSKPYHPIYSSIYGREISDKNRAFYFKKEFMKYITSLEN